MVPRNPHPKGSGPSSVSNIGGPRKRYLTRSIVDQLEWTLGCKGFTSIDTGVLIQEFAELAWRESWMRRKQHPGKSQRHQSQIQKPKKNQFRG